MSSCEGFSSRLKLLLSREESVVAFTRKSGIGDSLLRRYLTGSEPGLDKLIRIARAAAVRVEWLATGEGPMGLEADEPMMPRSSEWALRESGPLVDHELMGLLNEALTTLYREENARLAPRAFGELLAEKYEEIISTTEDTEERRVMVALIVTQHRKRLRMTSGDGSLNKRLA